MRPDPRSELSLLVTGEDPSLGLSDPFCTEKGLNSIELSLYFHTEQCTNVYANDFRLEGMDIMARAQAFNSVPNPATC